MIAKWIISGILCFMLNPVFSQISLLRKGYVDSLLQAIDTTTSNYQITQIADDLLQLLDTTQNSPILYQVYFKKGLSHFNSGDFGQALISQQKAGRIAHELQDSFLIAQSAYRIGIIQYRKKLYDSARQQFQTAVNVFSRLDSMRWVAYVNNAFGLLEREEKNWEAALSYYRQSYDILQKTGLSHLASVSLNNIGDVYFNQKKYEQSLQVFKASLELAQQQNEDKDIAIAHLNIGQSWRELKRFDIALSEIRAGLTLAREKRFKRIEAYGLKDISETFEKMGIPDSALTYLQAYLNLEDSLQLAENNARLEELYVAYETQKAQRETAAKQVEIESLKQEKRLAFLTNYFIISLLILALMISTFYFVRNRMKRKLAESELRNQKLEYIQMRRDLEGKQKDLTNLALEIARKNELFIKTNEALTEIQKINLPVDKQKRIRKLVQYNTQQLRINKDLEELQINIEQVNADFFEKLTQLAPDLTPAEKQLCSLLRLNLGTKEIASIRNISPKSVEMARYRLRKKLPIGANEDMHSFVQGI